VSKRVLLMTGDGGEALEVFYPYYRVQEAGHTVVLAAPRKKTVYTVIHDREPDWEISTTSSLPSRGVISRGLCVSSCAFCENLRGKCT